MIPLFLKIILVCSCFFIFLFFLRKIILSLIPFWRTYRKIDLLKHFIDSNIYDEATIIRAIKYYTPVNCQEMSPQRNKLFNSDFRFKKKDLTQLATRFFDQKGPFSIFVILADPGMGKTTFALNLYLYLKNRPQKSSSKLAIVPLNLRNADRMIRSIPDKKNTVLFLDGLEEDAMGEQNPEKRLIDLIEAAKGFKKMFLTASLNFIPDFKYKEIQKQYEKLHGKNPGKKHRLAIQQVFISPMSYNGAEKILNLYLPFWSKNLKRKTLETIRSNASGLTPFTLTTLPARLPKMPTLLSRSYLYKNTLAHWISMQKAWPDKDRLKKFLKLLAANLFLHRFSRGEESISTSEILQKAEEWDTGFHPFKKEAHALVVQTPSGFIRFTHRSVMEYLFVQLLMDGTKIKNLFFLTENMKSFLFELLEEELSSGLRSELMWLKPFDLKVMGIVSGPGSGLSGSPPTLFKTLLPQNTQHQFLTVLPRLFKNPIFAEFGWDPKLHENIEKALFHLKSSFMKFEKERWNVLINPKKIEISMRGKATRQIKLNKAVYEEYAGILETPTLIKMNQSIGRSGLKVISTINRSQDVAVLPDLENFKVFTLFFRRGR